MKYHFDFARRRDQLLEEVKNKSLANLDKFDKLQKMIHIQIPQSEEKRVLQNQEIKELKSNYEGPRKDTEVDAFLTEMKTMVYETKKKKKSKQLQKITGRSVSRVVSLPLIQKHSCWYKSLNDIDSVVRVKVFAKPVESNQLDQLKQNTSKLIKKAKQIYHIPFENMNESQLTIQQQTGQLSFEDGMYSIFQPQQSSHISNISIINHEPNAKGDYIPAILLKKLQKYKSATRDTSQILADKSLMSSAKQSRIITPLQYRKHPQSTYTEAQSQHDTISTKKRTFSQQELSYITPSFHKQSQFKLPTINAIQF